MCRASLLKLGSIIGNQQAVCSTATFNGCYFILEWCCIAVSVMLVTVSANHPKMTIHSTTPWFNEQKMLAPERDAKPLATFDHAASMGIFWVQVYRHELHEFIRCALRVWLCLLSSPCRECGPERGNKNIPRDVRLEPNWASRRITNPLNYQVSPLIYYPLF